MRTDFKSSPARLHAAARRAPSCTRIARLAVSNASFARGAPIRCSVPANEAHQQCKPILDHCGHLSRVTLYLSCDALAVPRAQLKVTSTNDAAACGAHRSRTCGSVRAASEIVARQTCSCRATKAGSTGDRNDTARPGISASQERGHARTNRRAPKCNREASDAPFPSKTLRRRSRACACCRRAVATPMRYFP